MTKINILHVAINYIRALENILHTGDAGFNSYGTAIVQSPFMPTPEQSDQVKEEQEMAKQQQQPVTRPQVVTKVLRPLNNVANINKQQPAAQVPQPPRNGRGLKVLHPQVQNNAGIGQGGNILQQQPVTRPQMAARPQVVTSPQLVVTNPQVVVTNPQVVATRPQMVTSSAMPQVTGPLVTNMTMSKNLEDEAFSGSEDSGIAEDNMEGLDCPDWTELTSTLEFPKQQRGSLDTMLPVASVTSNSSSTVTSSSQVMVARQVSFPELDSDPGADLFGDMILCNEEEKDVGKGLDMGSNLFDISDNFPLMI